MRRRTRRETEVFGLSFLDAICCGFGAIVLLLVITKTAEPTPVQAEGTGLEEIAETLASELPQLEMQQESLEAELAKQGKELAEVDAEIARIAPEAAAKSAKLADIRLDAKAAATIESKLATAKQQLTAEMERLYASGARPRQQAVGGIPIDSEYIVFVIDTSGSMHRYAWPLVIRKLTETLDSYPKVKGIQILNDMGDYMFGQYAGRWIPDTPGRRKAIIKRLSSWQPFSNSSPVEGITRAIRALAHPQRAMSIYVFGDEFTGPSIQAVLDDVRRLNPPDARGRRPARIHAIGFPVLFSQGQPQTTGRRFATLMRRLCYENDGTFVGLPALR